MKKLITYLLLTTAFISCSSVKIQSVTESNIQITDSIKASVTEISTIIEPYRTKLNQSMLQVLNISDIELPRPEYKTNPKPESLLANFVTDLCLKVGNELYKPSDKHAIDFCVLNNGGLRSSLPKGEITRGKVFELMPFENELIVLTLSGETTQKLINYIASANGVPVSYNLSMIINDKTASTTTINGKEFDTTKSYKVITSDYLSRGGDRMNFFTENLNAEFINIKLRDAIIKYIEDEKSAKRNITASLDKRIRIIE